MAIQTYVVLVVGFTVVVADVPLVTLPARVMLVALVAWQLSTTGLPGEGDGLGVAVNDVISPPPSR